MLKDFVKVQEEKKKKYSKPDCSHYYSSGEVAVAWHEHKSGISGVCKLCFMPFTNKDPLTQKLLDDDIKFKPLMASGVVNPKTDYVPFYTFGKDGARRLFF